MPLYLPWLVEQVREGGGEIRMQRVNSLGELSDGWADALVNCSGLGARELAGDLSVYPVRGQIVRVTNPGLTLSVRDENHPAGRAYVHPRTSDCMSTWPALVRARSTDSASVTSSAMPIAGWPSCCTLLLHRIGGAGERIFFTPGVFAWECISEIIRSAVTG